MNNDKISSEDAVWITGIYRIAFPHLYGIRPNEIHNTQKLGIDKYFDVEGIKRPLNVEEKIRTEDWGDLLLEDYSNYERRTPGWARDMSKITDYLAYIILPTRQLWLFYYPALRAYFLSNYEVLFHRYVECSPGKDYKYGETLSYDGGVLYRTANIPVPLHEFPKTWLLTNCWRHRG